MKCVFCNYEESFILCDNDCGTITCFRCEETWYIGDDFDSQGQPVVRQGHNPNCGAWSDSEDEDQ